MCGRAPAGTWGINTAMPVSAQAVTMPATPPDSVMASASIRKPAKIVSLGGAHRPADADLLATLAHRDEHHVGDADRADEQPDAAHEPDDELQRGEDEIELRHPLDRVDDLKLAARGSPLLPLAGENPLGVDDRRVRRLG